MIYEFVELFYIGGITGSFPRRKFQREEREGFVEVYAMIINIQCSFNFRNSFLYCWVSWRCRVLS